MRTLQFLKKEALHSLAAPETVLLMLLFPLLLTWVLGTAFSNISSHAIDLPETRMPIVSDGGMVAQGWGVFAVVGAVSPVGSAG